MKWRHKLEARLTEQENDILLEVYRQRYEHVRHLQQMRATYFNLYVAVIGFSIAALVSVYGDFGAMPAEAAILIGGVMWLISVLTMMRSERWGGHISHDLRTVREIQNALVLQFRSVAQVIPFNSAPLRSCEFDRPLWNRNRSIETPASVLGAVISAIFIARALPLVEWIQIVSGVLLAVIPILLWRSEVSNLQRRHAECCLSESRE